MKVSVRKVEFFVRNIRTRLPFKYGKAVLTATPILHVRMEVADGDGKVAVGCSADCLPPKWFDKSPEKTFRQNVEDLLAAAEHGRKAYLEAGAEPDYFFDLWLRAYAKTLEASVVQGLNGLTGSFGSSLMERALLDAFAKLEGGGLFDSIRSNSLRLQPEKIHNRLQSVNLGDCLPEAPLERVAVRHTVGLADPIRDADIAREDLLEDGLPQSLESWVREAGIRFFKIKVTSDPKAAISRLLAIASLLDRAAPSDYRVSLDGNETFLTVGEIDAWNRALRAEEGLRNLLDRVLYLEQPLERSVAFDAGVGAHLSEAPNLPPVVIDESDDALGTFKKATEFGYRGVSFKNCKGPMKGLFNKMLVRHFTVTEGREFLLTGEDLMNTSVVPLHQDLAMASILGLDHVERNGHHYCRGLDHLSKREIEFCLEAHAGMYEPFGEGGRLRIEDGFLDVSSLHREGFGSVGEPDFEFLTPLSEWRFESLGAPEEL